MLIVGAKGFAKEVLQIFYDLKYVKDISFYDDISTDVGDFLFNKFPVLKTELDAETFLKQNNNKFAIGIGNPYLRHKLIEKFSKIGGELESTISPSAKIGNYDVEIGIGTNILSNATISNSVKIGKGCILYYNVVVTHDCLVGDFVELSPNVILLGRVQVGDFSHIGANATILPDVKIGKNVIIGAGAVVLHDVPDNCCAVGIPAKIIKQNIKVKV